MSRLISICPFLSPHDNDRLLRVFALFAELGFTGYAVTGGLALEWRLRDPDARRALGDIDLVAPSLEALPSAIGGAFLVAHCHPDAAPGRTLIQLVHEETRLRVDVFTPFGATLDRAEWVNGVRLVAAEDIAARLAAILMDLSRERPVARKHAADFARLAPILDHDRADAAWRDHRKVDHPASFANAAALVGQAVRERPHLLIEPIYETDPKAVCLDCRPAGSFKCAPRANIKEVLGYC